MTAPVLDRECHLADGRPKRRFASRSEAKAQACRYPGNSCAPYRCLICGYFHLGHYPTNRLTRALMRDRHRENHEATR